MQFGTLFIAAIIALFVFVMIQVIFRIATHNNTTQQRLNEIRRTGPRFSSYEDGQSSGLALDASFSAEESGSALSEMTLEPKYSPLAITLRAFLESFGINVERHRRDKGMEYYRAGFNSPNHPIYFLAFQWFAGPFLLLLAAYLILFKETNGTAEMAMHALVGLMLGLAGLMGPSILLKNSRQKREKLLTNTFPDMLDLLLVCVETGLALDGALSRVTRELGKTAPEATEELNRTRLELSLLNDRKQALLNLAQRTNLAPYKTLVGAMLQTEQMGTSLTDTLRVLSEDYRMRRLMDAETRAGRLPVLITLPLVCFMLPALFIVIITPAIIKLMDTL
jgi:tight adherence protein C